MNISEPSEFLTAAMLSFPYRGPDDFKALDAQGQLVVSVALFSHTFGSAGYAGVLNGLRNWLEPMTQSLTQISAEPLASEMRRIMRLVELAGLSDDSEEDLWDAFISDNGDFRLETQRDLPTADEIVASALREHIANHLDPF